MQKTTHLTVTLSLGFIQGYEYTVSDNDYTVNDNISQNRKADRYGNYRDIESWATIS